jgi:hypothetical protein
MWTEMHKQSASQHHQSPPTDNALEWCSQHSKMMKQTRETVHKYERQTLFRRASVQFNETRCTPFKEHRIPLQNNTLETFSDKMHFISAGAQKSFAFYPVLPSNAQLWSQQLCATNADKDIRFHCRITQYPPVLKCSNAELEFEWNPFLSGHCQT